MTCDPDSDIGCERCPNCELYRRIFAYGPLYVTVVGQIVMMIMLVCSVRKTEKKAARWRTASVRQKVLREAGKSSSAREETEKSVTAREETEEIEKSTTGREIAIAEEEDEDERKSVFSAISSSIRTSISSALFRDIEERKARRRELKVTHVVAGRAFRYCVVFWITWLPIIINRTMQMMIGYSYFWVMFLYVIFIPLQGFWNFFVYIDLRVQAWWNEKKKEWLRAKEIENLKTIHGENYDPTIHAPSTTDDDDNLVIDESELWSSPR